MATEGKAIWQDISAQAQQRLADSIPTEWRIPESELPPPEVKNVLSYPAKCGLLSSAELAITDSFATEIVARIAAGEWSAEQVTVAFCKRAAIAHQLFYIGHEHPADLAQTKCLTITMFDAAIARAKVLDEHFATTGRVVGPLHGLPVSLKDNFNIPGIPSSLGFCSWALEPMQHESTIVTLLRELGAVPYVKTNVPTAMMIAESVNNTYGRTLNPLNRDLTSGGSSGGESALIAMHGSPLGVGTDIGGSLRIPASCTGLFTLRASYGRFPNFDARSGLAGQEAVGSVQGPLARSLADCRLFTDNVANASPWLRDPKCLPIPWRTVQLPPKLKFGLLRTNGMVTPTPPVSRALQTLGEKLRAAGHEVIEWSPDGLRDLVEVLFTFFLADGGQSVKKILESTNEPFRPEMEPYAQTPGLDVYQLWQVQARRNKLQKEYLDRWAAAGIDVLLSPTSPYVAPRNGCFKTVSYTGVFNVLDYSCVSFPTGIFADKATDVYPEGFRPVSDEDSVCHRDYDPADVHGLPVSLQLTARRLEEEKAMAVAERVLADIGGAA